MRKFVKRALEKIDRLEFEQSKNEQLRKLVWDVSFENELLEIVFDSMKAGIIVLNSLHRISFVNRTSKRLIPFVRRDPVDKLVWQAVNDNEIAGFLKEALLSEEKVTDREFTLENGYARTVLLSFMPIVREQHVQGNLIHIEDVTERRTKEARLRRAESLAALTTLSAGVAHEIKNPLTSIGIHIQLIQKQMRDRELIETKEIEKYLGVLNEEVSRLNKVVLDFLFAVRPMDMKLEQGPVNRVIQELLDFLRFELENAHVELRASLGDIPDIDLDDKHMKQALLNIIQNALQAMPDGGVLDVRTYYKNERVYVEIIDTGKGVPEDLIDKIFEPYFTTKEFGSGLGLTIVYKIIKEHGGEIFINSKEGEGTAFGLSFPVPQRVKRLLDYRREQHEV